MDKCACKGSFLERFVQPSVLMLLSKDDLHGFSIYKTLSESDIMDYSGIDPAGLYRTLKKMEGAGLLKSSWDTKAYAKPRRIFKITEEGRQCLKNWKKTLTSYRDGIDKLVNAISECTE